MRNGFGPWQLFARFATMLLLLKAFDILLFDWCLLCRSNFFPRYYPEVKAVLGPHLFGFNKKSRMVRTALIVVCPFAAALACTLMA